MRGYLQPVRLMKHGPLGLSRTLLGWTIEDYFDKVCDDAITSILHTISELFQNLLAILQILSFSSCTRLRFTVNSSPATSSSCSGVILAMKAGENNVSGVLDPVIKKWSAACDFLRPGNDI